MLEKIDILRSLAGSLCGAINSNVLSGDFPDAKIINQIVDDLALQFEEAICFEVLGTQDKEKHPELREKIQEQLKPLIRENVNALLKTVPEIYRENEIGKNISLPDATVLLIEKKKINLIGEAAGKANLFNNLVFHPKMKEAVGLAMDAKSKNKPKAMDVDELTVLTPLVDINTERAVKDAIKFNSSGINEVSVPLVQLKNGNEMRFADWAVVNKKLKFEDVNTTLIIGLIYNTKDADIPVTDYSAMNKLIKSATPSEKELLSRLIAEVIAAYPDEHTRGFVNNLLASDDKELSRFGKRVVSDVVEIDPTKGMAQIETVVAPQKKVSLLDDDEMEVDEPQKEFEAFKTPLDHILEKHPNAFARMYLQEMSKPRNKSLDVDPTKLSYREINSLIKIADEVHKQTNKEPSSPLEAIKAVLNAFLSHISKDLGLKSKDFKVAFEELKERAGIKAEAKHVERTKSQERISNSQQL